MPELKPCPFCGSEAKLTGPISTAIDCSNKACRAHLRIPYDQEEHIALWNTRSAAFNAPVIQGVRPCPLCGSRDTRLSFIDLRVYCNNCKLTTDCFTLGTYQDAIDAWNRRQS